MVKYEESLRDEINSLSVMYIIKTNFNEYNELIRGVTAWSYMVLEPTPFLASLCFVTPYSAYVFPFIKVLLLLVLIV